MCMSSEDQLEDLAGWEKALRAPITLPGKTSEHRRRKRAA